MTDIDPAVAAPQDGDPPGIRILAQFVRDLSFENPRAPEALRGGAQPQIDLGVEMNARGVLYADGEMPPSLWRFLGSDRFPEAIPVPQGYAALAAGGEDALLMDTNTAPLAPTLYRMPLP